MNQLNIFDMFETNEYIPKGKLIPISPEVFQIPKGTKVYIGSHYSLVYEVIEDDGNNATVRYVRGYRGKLDEEMTISSLKIHGISEPEKIPLPIINRPKNLDLEVYKDMQRNFLEGLSEGRKLDLLTYLLILSPFDVTPDEVIQHLKEGDIEQAKRTMTYGISYIRDIGIDSPISFSYYHDDYINVIWYKNYTKPIRCKVDNIIQNFIRMNCRINDKEVDQLNPFELIMLYRLKGYFLSYRIETNEWFIQHPYSKKVMPIKKGREALNDVMATIKSYEKKVKKENNIQMLYNTELDLFPEEETFVPEEIELSGFCIPKNSIVTVEAGKKYVVINDDGEKALLKPINEENGIEIEVNSNEIRFVYPFDNPYLSIQIPYYNRPKSLLMETLIERRRTYYHNLTDRELIDLSVCMITERGYSTTVYKFLRAMEEGDEEEAKNILSNECSGLYTNDISFTADYKKFELKFGINRERVFNFTVNDVINHYKKMINNTKALPFPKLTLGELIMAYRLRGYLLKYNHVTEEYFLSKHFSNTKIFISKGRSELNNIEQTIKRIEPMIDKEFKEKTICS